MKLSDVKQAAKLSFASNVTLALVGVSGSGKTSIWKQIYKDLGFDSYLILRPSLMADSSDLTGLYDFEMIRGKDGVEVKTTAYARPKFLPLKDEKVLIILDEINRINKDVANAIFGLIEAEGPTVGEYSLPNGSKVVATLNPPTSNYSNVLDFKDNAWSSRMSFVKIVPNLEDFSNYGKNTGKVSNLTIDFFTKNQKFFGSGEDFSVEMFGLNAVDNTRSKEKISTLEQQATLLGISDDILREVITGIAGKEMALAFMQHRQHYNTIISVDEIFDNSNNALERFNYNELSAINKILDGFNERVKDQTLKVEQVKNVASFLNKIPLDTMLPFVDSMNDICEEEEKEDIDNAKFRKVIALELDKDDDLIARCEIALKLKEQTTQAESATPEAETSSEIPF